MAADKQKILQILKDHGIPVHLNGFDYLLEGIAISIDSPYLLHGMLTKSLYPAIAKKFNTSWTSVERSLRNAISKSSTPEHTPGSFIKDVAITLKMED